MAAGLTGALNDWLNASSATGRCRVPAGGGLIVGAMRATNFSVLRPATAKRNLSNEDSSAPPANEQSKRETEHDLPRFHRRVCPGLVRSRAVRGNLEILMSTAADIDAEALRAALVIDSGRLNTNKTQRIAAIQSEIVRAMTRTSTKAPREWFSDLNDLVSKGLSAVKQDAEDERTLNMTRPEIEAELSKTGETFAGAVAQTDAAIMRGIAEAQMRKAIQAWLKCPAEKRPSAFSLGHQIEQAAMDFIRAELRTTNR